MYDDRFRRPSVMKEIMEREVKVVPTENLCLEDEITLFLQFNYARYKMEQVRKAILRNKDWPLSKIKELQAWYQLSCDVQSQIVSGNLGLVLSMAKRVSYPTVEFTDLVSEGSMALLRASEKFNCALGWKFSTYACRAILKSFSRAAKQNYRYRGMFPAQWDPALERDDYLEQCREETHEDWVEEVRVIVRENLAELSEIERAVVKMRFSLDDDGKGEEDKPLTLKEAGAKLGLTKERIRQIQNKALGKLKVVAEERMTIS